LASPVRVGIMQPYFFPYLGHFAMIANSDEWLVFDVTQYTPKSWMSRNRVLHPSSGWMYISVPLTEASRSLLTSDVRVRSPNRAHSSALGKLSHYARRAPFFTQVTDLVDRTFSQATNDSLVQLNVAGLRETCDYLGLEFKYSICSELGLDLSVIEGPGDWAPAITEAVGANAYINPIGGRHLFDPAAFRRRHIELSFLEMPPFTYDTRPYHFEPQLSILDVLMWNSPEAVRRALRTATVTRVQAGAV
jgi:WbqC-like protein family